MDDSHDIGPSCDRTSDIVPADRAQISELGKSGGKRGQHTATTNDDCVRAGHLRNPSTERERSVELRGEAEKDAAAFAALRDYI